MARLVMRNHFVCTNRLAAVTHAEYRLRSGGVETEELARA